MGMPGTRTPAIRATGAVRATSALPAIAAGTGTHVAGTIAAITNNGLGVAGVAPAARILPVRVLGRCGGLLSDVTGGMRWAAGLSIPGVANNANPARVLNLSLVGRFYQFERNS
jgi:subtilisin family serine protease